MKEVTVRKNELIDKLTANLNNHRQDFADAHAAWQLEAINFHETRIKDITSGVKGTSTKDKLEPAEPASYEKNYLQALEMLEMEVGTHVVLGSLEFRQYVQDEWDFSSHFKTQVQGYTGKLSNNY